MIDAPRRLAAVCIVAFASLLPCRSASAYSVLAHEAMVDALWEGTITPLLRERFPGIAVKQITAARAYAYDAARDRYRTLLKTAGRQAADSGRGTRAEVVNMDLDTGKPPVRAYNPLVEETYADFLDKLSKVQFAGVSKMLREDLTRHYAAPLTGRPLARKDRQREQKALRQLEAMSQTIGPR